MKSLSVLIITTSNNRFNESKNKAGVWLEDLAEPYFIFKDSGNAITIASPLGGRIPIDINTESSNAITANTKRFQQDEQAMYHFSHSLPLGEINTAEFDLVFITGAYGVMWDFADNQWLKQVIYDCVEQQKPVGLVGHAVVALVSLVTKEREPFVKGRRLTAFSNHETLAAGLYEQSPFSLETILVSLGAIYSSGDDFKSYAVADRNIVTGQNPASSGEVAKQILAMATQFSAINTVDTQ